MKYSVLACPVWLAIAGVSLSAEMECLQESGRDGVFELSPLRIIKPPSPLMEVSLFYILHVRI